MATQTSRSHLPPATEPALAPRLPKLENGDVLTRSEFERRYVAMPGLKKAELIDGVVYVGPPVALEHADADARFTTLLSIYAASTPNTQAVANATVRFDLENEVQPDALLRIKSGGQSRAATYIEGAPELVVEVASSSVSRDLHAKLQLYRRHGVREYIVWRVLDSEIDWFRLEEGDYQRHAPDEQGIFRSRDFPGLWLDRAALLRGDLQAALATLNAGLASPEHAEFTQKLAALAVGPASRD